jgi:hypothetical protein
MWVSAVGRYTSRHHVAMLQCGSKDIVILFGLRGVTVENADAQLSDGDGRSLLESTMQLFATEMSSGRQDGFVAEMDVVLITPENEPVSTAFWMLNDFMLQFGLSILENLVERGCLRLPDSSSLLSQVVFIICHIPAFSLVRFTADCISIAASFLSRAVSIKRRSADLDATTHLYSATF